VSSCIIVISKECGRGEREERGVVPRGVWRSHERLWEIEAVGGGMMIFRTT